MSYATASTGRSRSIRVCTTCLHRALKVDADARLRNAQIFGHAVHPVFLRASAHHDEIAGAGFERDGRASGARLDEEPARRAQREHRNDALRSSTREAIA